MHKYKIDENGDIIPSRDSDLYCYITMFLNTISGVNMYHLSINDFYCYINYLDIIGINPDLIYSLERIYSDAPNENILPYLDEVDVKKLYQAHHSVYRLQTGVDLTKL